MSQKIKRILLLVAISAIVIFLIVVGFAIFAALAVIVAVMALYRRFKLRREIGKVQPGRYSAQKGNIQKKNSVIEAEYEIIDDDK